MRFRSKIILNIPQYYFHMAAILKNGCHFFPAEYRQGSPPRSCAGRSPEHVDTQHVFTTAHVRWTPKIGFCPLGIMVFLMKPKYATLLDCKVLKSAGVFFPSFSHAFVFFLPCRPVPLESPVIIESKLDKVEGRKYYLSLTMKSPDESKTYNTAKQLILRVPQEKYGIKSQM